MNEKEVAEIRRRYKHDKSNITHIRGCYVNDRGEILSEFTQALALMTEEESEKFLSILKRTLSGTLEKNLIDISFSTDQVVHSEEHKLLMTLRNSTLQDEVAVKTFFERVIGSLSLEENYLILLAHDSYDVPFRSKDDETQADASSEVFSYILCSICPIKMTKPALGYYVHENTFHSCKLDWIVSPPELGFLFPSFDDRSTNLYNALYYTRDTAAHHMEFVDSVFRSDLPMPAATQKETFHSLLCDTLAEDYSLDLAQTVHEDICGLIEENRCNKEEPPRQVSKESVTHLLHSCGVSEPRVSAFGKAYDDTFGADTELSPRNIADSKKLEIRTPDVTIQVNPERSDLVQTRVIGGLRYLLIRAEDGVEVNGVSIHIS